MNPEAKILVVDDEENIRSSLQEMLSHDGYQVVAVNSGEAAINLVEADEKFDLALIDLKLEDVDGMEVLAALREHSPETAVIILTAFASLETAVAALRQGAHDYLFKPCKVEELQESIRKGLQNRQSDRQQEALLRQLDHLAHNLEDLRSTILEQKTPSAETAAAVAESPAAPQPPDKPDESDDETRFVEHGRLVVDFLRHAITLDGELLDLSPTEFGLVAYLVRHAPRVISPQELSREVQKYESEPWEASEAVRQHIYRIRQKIKDIDEDPDVIRTVRGIGYTIQDR